MTANVLRATFVRHPGERDRIYVTRSDGSEVSWSFPTYEDGLPHDLVHLVVEACCGLRSGFWGRVDTGADPGMINAEASRIGGKRKYTRFGPDQAELYVAEALAGAPWWQHGVTHDELYESVKTQCARLGVPSPDLSPVQTARIQSVLFRLAGRWRALAPKGSLTVTFQPDPPAGGLDELACDGAVEELDGADGASRRRPW